MQITLGTLVILFWNLSQRFFRGCSFLQRRPADVPVARGFTENRNGQTKKISICPMQ